MDNELTVRDFIEDLYYIKDKESNLVPLKFNHAQETFYEALKRDYGVKPARFIILKARQLGMSTFSEAMITYLATHTPNTDAVILAHTSESSSKIYEMTQLFIDSLPDGMKPQQKYSNRKMLVFDGEDGLKSSIRVMVANDSTRGGTYKLAHLSEVAFWEHPEDALLALNQAVPMSNESLIIIESTANGFNYFYNLWQVDSMMIRDSHSRTAEGSRRSHPVAEGKKNPFHWIFYCPVIGSPFLSLYAIGGGMPTNVCPPTTTTD